MPRRGAPAGPGRPCSPWPTLFFSVGLWTSRCCLVVAENFSGGCGVALLERGIWAPRVLKPCCCLDLLGRSSPQPVPRCSTARHDALPLGLGPGSAVPTGGKTELPGLAAAWWAAAPCLRPGACSISAKCPPSAHRLPTPRWRLGVGPCTVGGAALWGLSVAFRLLMRAPALGGALLGKMISA